LTSASVAIVAGYWSSGCNWIGCGRALAGGGAPGAGLRAALAVATGFGAAAATGLGVGAGVFARASAAGGLATRCAIWSWLAFSSPMALALSLLAADREGDRAVGRDHECDTEL